MTVKRFVGYGREAARDRVKARRAEGEALGDAGWEGPKARGPRSGRAGGGEAPKRRWVNTN